MLIAGETSGDWLAADLVRALRDEYAKAAEALTWDYQPLRASLEPYFFGAGGPQMAAAGVELAFDLTQHSVIGISDVLKQYFKFRRLLHQLYKLALEREPDVIICIDFSGFNRRLAHAIKSHVRGRLDWFHDWNPKLVQYVSPQVWASREGRAYQLANDFNLLLSIFPFEKEWYARRVPKLRIDFVGHPMLDRYAGCDCRHPAAAPVKNPPVVVLLPGSRPGELTRHIPVLDGALKILKSKFPGLRGVMVVPNETLSKQAKSMSLAPEIELRVGNLPAALKEADVALASTGTVTMECAYCGVPTVAFYKTSWSTYQLGKQIVRVRHLAMPNLLANEEIFPEFVQHTATAENIASSALSLLQDENRRRKIKTRLGEIVASLGAPGANRRAARGILSLLDTELKSMVPAL